MHVSVIIYSELGLRVDEVERLLVVGANDLGILSSIQFRQFTPFCMRDTHSDKRLRNKRRRYKNLRRNGPVS